MVGGVSGNLTRLFHIQQHSTIPVYQAQAPAFLGRLPVAGHYLVDLFYGVYSKDVGSQPMAQPVNRHLTEFRVRVNPAGNFGPISA